MPKKQNKTQAVRCRYNASSGRCAQRKDGGENDIECAPALSASGRCVLARTTQRKNQRTPAKKQAKKKSSTPVAKAKKAKKTSPKQNARQKKQAATGSKRHATPTPSPSQRNDVQKLRRLLRVARSAVTRWQQQQHDKHPVATLKAVLACYPTDGEAALERISQQIAAVGEKALERLGATVRLVIPEFLNTPGGGDAVRLYHALRFPVHMPQASGISEAMKKALGYTMADVKELEDSRFVGAGVRYCVLGKALSLRDTSRHLWYVHTWGVHCGDSGYIVGPQPQDSAFIRAYMLGAMRGPEDAVRVYMDAYTLLAGITVENIRTAVRHVMDTEKNPAGYTLQWNGLGTGVWALPGDTETLDLLAKGFEAGGEELDHRQIQQRMAQQCERWWQDQGFEVGKALNAEQANREAVYVQVPFFNKANPGASYTAGGFGRGVPQQVFDHADPFAAFQPNPDQGPEVLKGRTAIILNAWDDWSMIGNGLCTDDTLDGWTVCGGHPNFRPSKVNAEDGKSRRLGWQAVSTAYLHNAVFVPSVFKTAKMLVSKANHKTLPLMKTAAQVASVPFWRGVLFAEAEKSS